MVVQEPLRMIRQHPRIGVQVAAGVDQVWSPELFHQGSGAAEVTRHQAVVIAEHDHPVARAVHQRSVPIVRHRHELVAARVFDPAVLQRIHPLADVLVRRVVRDDDLPIVVVLPPDGIDGELQVLEPVSGGEEGGEFQPRTAFLNTSVIVAPRRPRRSTGRMSLVTARATTAGIPGTRLRSDICHPNAFHPSPPTSVLVSNTVSSPHACAASRIALDGIKARCRGASRCAQYRRSKANWIDRGFGTAITTTPPGARAPAAASRTASGRARCSRTCQSEITSNWPDARSGASGSAVWTTRTPTTSRRKAQARSSISTAATSNPARLAR